MSYIIDSEDFDFSCDVNDIPTFRTKSEAQKISVSVGWKSYNVIKIKKRFETVWIVGCWIMEGKKMFDDCDDIIFDYIRFPMLEYKYINGIKNMIVETAVAKTARSYQ